MNINRTNRSGKRKSDVRKNTTIINTYTKMNTKIMNNEFYPILKTPQSTINHNTPRMRQKIEVKPPE